MKNKKLEEKIYRIADSMTSNNPKVEKVLINFLLLCLGFISMIALLSFLK